MTVEVMGEALVVVQCQVCHEKYMDEVKWSYSSRPYICESCRGAR